jgi:prevent-host-death family protein
MGISLIKMVNIMIKTVNIQEAKTHLSKLLKDVENGEEINLAKSGKPVAKIVPLDYLSLRVPGLLKGKSGQETLEPLPYEELDTWNQREFYSTIPSSSHSWPLSTIQTINDKLVCNNCLNHDLCD